MKTGFSIAVAAAAVPAAIVSLAASADQLKIITSTSDPGQPEALQELIDRFQAANEDVQVELTINGSEEHKTAIRNFLQAEPPDLTTWYAGARMRIFSDKGLFADLTELWEQEGLAEAMASSDGLVRGSDGKVYGLPYTYYQWGIYYRKDVLDANGISEPASWQDIIDACKTLRANGIEPIAIGTKYLWTAAGWFDYLNLRINGLEFHLDLTDGNVSYTDPRLDAVFEHWAELISSGCFLENHATYDWAEGIAPLIDGSAGMTLIGNFVMGSLREAGVDGMIEYVQFPPIKEGMAMYEDAPVDTWHIPANAANKEDAMRFLAFAAQPENNALLPNASGTLAPHKDAPVPDDRFLQEGQKVLAEAAGLAQFYDRDTDPEMAKAGMEGFQEFMVNPDRVNDIRERLEKTRQRVFDQQ